MPIRPNGQRESSRTQHVSGTRRLGLALCTLSLLATAAAPRAAGGAPRLHLGTPAVTAKQAEGGAWEIAVSFQVDRRVHFLLVAPSTRHGVSIAAEPRYVLLDGAACAKGVSATFRVTLGESRQLDLAVLGQYSSRVYVREALRLRIAEGANALALHKLEWQHADRPALTPRHRVVVRGPIERWLAQGLCVVEPAPPAAHPASPTSWDFDRAHEPLATALADTRNVDVADLPLVMNNLAVQHAEAGELARAGTLLERADRAAGLLGTRADLRAVLWLNRGIVAYAAGKHMLANQSWRTTTLYPKAHVGIAGALCQMVRRRMETLQVEVAPDLGYNLLTKPASAPAGDATPDLLGKGPHVRSSVTRLGALSLSEEAGEALRTHTAEAMTLRGESLYLLMRKAPSAKAVLLLEVSLDHGAVLGRRNLKCPPGHLDLRVARDGVWLVDRKAGQLVHHNLLGQRDFDVRLDVWAGKTVAGQFFDGTTWWIVAAEGRSVTVGRVDAKARTVRREFSETLPEEATRVAGLSFAAPGMADIVYEGAIDLKAARQRVQQLHAIAGRQAVLNTGGAARLALLQLLEATRGGLVRYVAIYRRQSPDRGKSIHRVLRDRSGQVIGARGSARAVFGVQGTRHANTALVVEHDLARLRERCHTILLLNRHLNVRAVLPLREPRPYLPVRRPLVAFTDHRVAWHWQGSDTVHFATQKAETIWVWQEKTKPYVPTKKRPIILDKGDLLFGGEDGQRRDRIKWPVRPVAVLPTPNQQVGCAVIAGEDVGTVLRMFGPDRKLLKEVRISPKAYDAMLKLDPTAPYIPKRVGYFTYEGDFITDPEDWVWLSQGQPLVF